MPRLARDLFLTAILCIAIPAMADVGDDLESFNAAYTAYKTHATNGDFERALPESRRAYELGQKIFGEGSKELPALAFNYGAMLAQVGNDEEAIPVFKYTLRLNESLYGKNATQLISTLMELGKIVGGMDARPKKRQFNRALDIAKDHYGRKSADYGLLALKVGRELQNRTVSLNAEKYLKSAYEILGETLGEKDEATTMAAYRLGRVYFVNRRYRIAEPYLLAALDSFADPDRPAGQIEIDTHAYLIELYEETGRPEKATSHCLALGRVTPDKGDKERLPIYRTAPIYPAAALFNRSQGYVSFRFTVDEMGKVRDPEATEVVGHPDFEMAALEVLKKWRYAPRFVDGEPVPTENMTTRISFQIDGGKR